MKYNELHRKLRKYGCYLTGKQQAGHPEWYSPITGRKFATSNHESQEVKTGTLKSILRDAGIK
jgi:predicted RNA binding protein YcfA (HicA-like mRNA interferase family)